MKTFFMSLVDYDVWATKLLAKTMKTNGIHDSEIPVKGLNHMIYVNQMWYDRLVGKEMSLPKPPDYDFEGSLSHYLELMEAYKKLVEGANEGDLASKISYKNTKGLPFDNTMSEILFNVLNHGTHHRNGLSRFIRKSGYTPPPTDYIFYLREK